MLSCILIFFPSVSITSKQMGQLSFSDVLVDERWGAIVDAGRLLILAFVDTSLAADEGCIGRVPGKLSVGHGILCIKACGCRMSVASCIRADTGHK